MVDAGTRTFRDFTDISFLRASAGAGHLSALLPRGEAGGEPLIPPQEGEGGVTNE